MKLPSGPLGEGAGRETMLPVRGIGLMHSGKIASRRTRQSPEGKTMAGARLCRFRRHVSFPALQSLITIIIFCDIYLLIWLKHH
jgi:hypothetical protein